MCGGRLSPRLVRRTASGKCSRAAICRTFQGTHTHTHKHTHMCTHTRMQVLNRSAAKSVAAGIAGAALTNPLDVIRNEMFKFDETFGQTVARLLRTEGYVRA